MSLENVETIELNEVYRTYIFPNNQELKIEGSEVCYINENGTHQLRNNKGEIYIIPPRWLAFKIQQKDKTETMVEREKEEVKE